jgi:hypothetical protein
VLGVGVTGLLTAVLTGAVRPGSGASSTPAVALGGSSCQEWLCGTNHNQVLL